MCVNLSSFKSKVKFEILLKLWWFFIFKMYDYFNFVFTIIFMWILYLTSFWNGNFLSVCEKKVRIMVRKLGFYKN
jgi:hypothetical protein